MKVFIVIAAYNEEKKIGKVVKGLKKEKYTNIIVTDDHSSDKTASVAKKAGAIVLEHKVNQGQGAATGAAGRTDYRKEDQHDTLSSGPRSGVGCFPGGVGRDGG